MLWDKGREVVYRPLMEQANYGGPTFMYLMKQSLLLGNRLDPWEMGNIIEQL